MKEMLCGYLGIFIIISPEFFTKCLFHMCALQFHRLNLAFLWDGETPEPVHVKCDG